MANIDISPVQNESSSFSKTEQFPNYPIPKLSNSQIASMFIYNVTIQIDPAVEPAWLQWMQQIHIPEVMATGCFTGYRMLLLHDLEHSDWPTYAVQYEAASKTEYEQYVAAHAPRLRQAALDAWGKHFTAFRTLMQQIDAAKSIS